MPAEHGLALDAKTRLPGFYSEAGEITLLGGIAIWALVLVAALPASTALARRVRRRGGSECAASGLVGLSIFWPAALALLPLAAPILILRLISMLVAATEPVWLPSIELVSACRAGLRARRARTRALYGPRPHCAGRRWDEDMPWNRPDPTRDDAFRHR